MGTKADKRKVRMNYLTFNSDGIQWWNVADDLLFGRCNFTCFPIRSCSNGAREHHVSKCCPQALKEVMLNRAGGGQEQVGALLPALGCEQGLALAAGKGEFGGDLWYFSAKLIHRWALQRWVVYHSCKRVNNMVLLFTSSIIDDLQFPSPGYKMCSVPGSVLACIGTEVHFL